MAETSHTEGAAFRVKRAGPPWLVIVMMAWLAGILFVALFADRLMAYEVGQMNLRLRLGAPQLSGPHWLGTDELGRDLLSRLIMAVRISIMIAGSAAIVSAVLGTLLGFLAAHFRGFVEQLILMLADFQASVPFFVLALTVLAFMGSSLPLLIGLMSLYGWERYARIARNLALSATRQSSTVAAWQLGATPMRLYTRHILPNIASTLIVSLTIIFPELILLESGLSFLGLGVQPPMTSLGNLIGFEREYIARAPWLVIAPAMVIMLTTLSISIIGDWIRDWLDPSHEGMPSSE